MSHPQSALSPSDLDQSRRQTSTLAADDGKPYGQAGGKQRERETPKRGRTAYMLWADVHRERVRAEHPHLDFGGIGSILGETWKKLDPKEKERFEEFARKDEIRYEEELARYNASSPASPVVIRRKLPANYSLLPSTVSTASPQPQPQPQPQPRTQPSSSQTPAVGTSVASGRSPRHETATPASSVSAMPTDSPESIHPDALSQREIDEAMGQCLKVLTDAVTLHSKRPFSALLLAPDNSTVLLTHNSISHIQHAESELARLASLQYSMDYLSRCSLVSTWEPCAMCAGTIYWSGIGRVLYAAGEAKLRELTGSGNDENLTMDLPCRSVLNSGQRKIEVVGPLSGWEDTVTDHCRSWWEHHQSSHQSQPGSSGTNANGQHSRNTSNVVVVVPEDSLLGSIGEDGEYQADLKVDWMT